MAFIAVLSFASLLVSGVQGAPNYPNKLGDRAIEFARAHTPSSLQPPIAVSSDLFAAPDDASDTPPVARNVRKRKATKAAVFSARQKSPNTLQPAVPRSDHPSAPPHVFSDTVPTFETRDANDTTSNSCSWSTDSDLNQLPDLVADAQAYATANWGSDWEQMWVNPSSWPAYPSQICFSTAAVDPAWTGDPTCSTQDVTFNGIVTAGTNTASVLVSTGDSLTATTTTEQSTAIAIGIMDTVEVTAEIFKETETDSFMATITNTKGSSNSVTNNRITTVTETIACTGPANVSVIVKETTCVAQGTATVPMVFGGWVWFTYKDQKNGHWNWAVNVDYVGTSPIAHRTTNMQLSVAGQVDSYGSFTSNCGK